MPCGSPADDTAPLALSVRGLSSERAGYLTYQHFAVLHGRISDFRYNFMISVRPIPDPLYQIPH